VHADNKRCVDIAGLGFSNGWSTLQAAAITPYDANPSEPMTNATSPRRLLLLLLLSVSLLVTRARR